MWLANRNGRNDCYGEKAKEHSWFVGFAPVEDPKIAVAVVIEYGGSGSETAAFIARDIIKKYLS